MKRTERLICYSLLLLLLFFLWLYRQENAELKEEILTLSHRIDQALAEQQGLMKDFEATIAFLNKQCETMGESKNPRQ